VPAERSRSPFSYLILRAVPSIERGERVNVGVVLFCRQRGFLGARVSLDEPRLAVLRGGTSDLAGLREHLDALLRVVEGAPDAGAVAALDPSERFGWIAAPSSTLVQPSAVHTGLCALHARLVA
jgi:hypothetical protein